jgi:hypothetical protein
MQDAPHLNAVLKFNIEDQVRKPSHGPAAKPRDASILAIARRARFRMPAYYLMGRPNRVEETGGNIGSSFSFVIVACRLQIAPRLCAT